MRFKATKDNLRVILTPDKVAACVRKTAALLVPKFTQQLYVLAVPAVLYQGADAGVTLLRTGQEPADFLQSYRVIIRPGELTVVGAQGHPFTKDQWYELADQIDG